MSCPQRGTPRVWGFSGIGCTERGVPKTRGTLGMGEPQRTVGCPKRESPWEWRVGVRCAGTNPHGAGHAAPRQDCALAPTRWFPEPGSSRSLHCGCAAEGWGWGGRQGSFAPPVSPHPLPPEPLAREARRPGWNGGWLRARAVGERGGAGRGSWPGFFQTEPGVP